MDLFLENTFIWTTLGAKILGVPVLIGVNWIILTFITGSLSSFLFKNKFLSVLMGAVFMILLDLLIEPVAPLLGFLGV